MGDFGAELRKEREARGITLQAITHVTKIGNRHLEALEQDQFQLLPGGVFNKNIVREYARVVGLNEEEWVQRFSLAFRASSSFVGNDSDWVQFAENASKAREAAQGRRPDMRLRWAGVGVLLLFLLGLSWSVWSYVHHKFSSPAHLPAQITPVTSSPSMMSGSGGISNEKVLPSRRPSDSLLQGRRHRTREKRRFAENQ